MDLYQVHGIPMFVCFLVYGFLLAINLLSTVSEARAKELFWSGDRSTRSLFSAGPPPRAKLVLCHFVGLDKRKGCSTTPKQKPSQCVLCWFGWLGWGGVAPQVVKARKACSHPAVFQIGVGHSYVVSLSFH